MKFCCLLQTEAGRIWELRFSLYTVYSDAEIDRPSALILRRMPINLCNSAFGVTVSTTSICSEGHGAENLLESDGTPASRSGFMAERFIKPPVEVIFSFPIRVEVSDVLIESRVGNQRSCGFEILTASATPPKTGPENKQRAQEMSFETIGKSPWGYEDASCHFVNRRYHQKLPEFGRNCGSSSNIQSFVLRHRLSEFILKITHLKIRIFRTINGSIPCLRSVMVLGQPSYSCSKSEIDGFVSKLRFLSIKKEVPPENIRTEIPGTVISDVALQPGRSKQVIPDDVFIPEEFKDALTFDLMPMPVILPSGRTIDQTTLDKHIAAEAKWGRPPSDPFTGLVFTNVSKPLPNLMLKSRVDKFLLSSGRKFEHLPRRTIGVCDKGVVADTGFGRDIYPAERREDLARRKDTISSCGHSGTSVDVPGAGCSQASFQSSDEKLPCLPKQSKPFIPMNTQKRKSEGSSSDPRQSDDKRRLTASSPGPAASHEEVIRDSLTDALNSTLAQLPSFGENQRVASTKEKLACVKCSTEPSSDGSRSFYRCPCDHIYCRNCLSECSGLSDIRRRLCAACGTEISLEDVTRVHDTILGLKK